MCSDCKLDGDNRLVENCPCNTGGTGEDGGAVCGCKTGSDCTACNHLG